MNPQMKTRSTPNSTLMMRCRQDASDHSQRVLILTGAPSAWFQRTTNLVSSCRSLTYPPLWGQRERRDWPKPNIADLSSSWGFCEVDQGSALMATLDLKAAYVLVHPKNQSLLTISWGGTTYLNTALPFSLCSAPKLVTAIFDGLAWCMVCKGISHFLQHLDDFFLCPPRQAWNCGQSLSVAVKLCQDLGFPVVPD